MQVADIGSCSHSRSHDLFISSLEAPCPALQVFTYLPTIPTCLSTYHLINYLPTYLLLYLHTYLPAYQLSTYIFTHLSTYLPTCLSIIYLHIYSFIYIPTYLLINYLPTFLLIIYLHIYLIYILLPSYTFLRNYLPTYLTLHLFLYGYYNLPAFLLSTYAVTCTPFYFRILSTFFPLTQLSSYLHTYFPTYLIIITYLQTYLNLHMQTPPQETEVDVTTRCQLVVLNSNSKLHLNSTLTPLLNSSHQLGEIWVHKLALNSSF